MGDTMWGFWKTTMGCGDFLNGIAQFERGEIDTTTGELVAIPKATYTEALHADLTSPFGARFEAWSGSFYALTQLPVQGDFTFTNLPHNSTSQNLNSIVGDIGKLIHDPDNNKFYRVFAAYLAHSYFVPISQPGGPGTFQNYYVKIYVLEYDIDAKTITRILPTGIGQLDFDSFIGDNTTGILVTVPISIPSGFTTYANGHIWVSHYIKNDVYSMFKINVSSWVGSQHNITASGYAPGQWLAGREANGEGWCIPSSAAANNFQPFIRVNTGANTITYSTFGLGSTFKWIDMIAHSNGDIYACPDNAPGILHMDVFSSTPTIDDLGYLAAAGTLKTCCIMEGPDERVLVVPRGTSAWRTFGLFDPDSFATTEYYQNFGFAGNPFSADVFAGGAISADYNFFCVPQGNNTNQMLFGGIRDQPSDPVLIPSEVTGDVGNGGKATGLRPPFILHDWRNYDGDFLLHNEGTGGPVWDLAVVTNNGFNANTKYLTGIWHWKYLDWTPDHFDGRIVGRALTFVFAVGAGEQIDGINNESTFMFMETGAFSGGPPLSINGSLDIVYTSLNGMYVDEWDMGTSLDDFTTYLQLFANNTYDENNATVIPDSPLGVAVMMVMNNNQGGASWFVDGVNQGNPTQNWVDPIEGDQFESEFYHAAMRSGAGSTYDEYGGADGILISDFERYFHYGIDSGYVDDTIPLKDQTWPGQTPDALIGIAVFRGEPATQAEVDYWKDYFYT